MARESDIFGLQPSRINIGPGATAAVLIDQVAGEGALILKYFSGGSLEIIQAPVGTTSLGSSLAAAIGTGYLMSTTEVLNISGAARFYLMGSPAAGATTVAMVIRGLTSGF